MSSPIEFQASATPVKGREARLGPVHVDAAWDEDASVWVAICDDIPGLATEAATIDELCEKLSAMIPELIEANALTFDQTEIPVKIHAVRLSRVLNPRAPT